MALVVQELEASNDCRKDPVEVLGPIAHFGLEEEDFSHHKQPVDEPVVEEVLCRARNRDAGVGEHMNVFTLYFSLQVVQESDDGTELGCVRAVLRDVVSQRNGNQRAQVLQEEELW